MLLRENIYDNLRADHSAVARASGNRRMAAAACDQIEQADRRLRVSIAIVIGGSGA